MSLISGIDNDSIVLSLVDDGVAITPSQYYTSFDYLARHNDNLISTATLGEDPDPQAWRTFFSGDRAWVVRTIRYNDVPAAYITIEFNFSSIIPLSSSDELILVGYDSTLIYSSSSKISSSDYEKILDGTLKNRSFSWKGTRYSATKNVFSNVDLDIIAALPSNFIRYTPVRYTFLLTIDAVLLVLVAALSIQQPIINKKIELLVTEESSLDATQLHYSLGQSLALMLTMPDQGNYLVQSCLDAANISSTSSFCLIGLYVDDKVGVFTPPDGQITSDIKSFALFNLLSELMFEERAGTACIMGNYYVAIAELDDSKNTKGISAVISKLQAIYREYFSAELIVTEPMPTTASTMTHNLRQVCSSIEHKSFWLTDRPAETQPDETFSPMYFKLMARLLSCFEQKKLDTAEEIFQQILDTCLPSEAENLEIARNRVYTMCDMLVSVNGIKPDDLSQDFMKINSIGECRRVGKQIFDNLIAQQQTTDSSGTTAQKRVKKIKVYVKEHYSDRGMNVTSVAENFDLNVTYLSRIFKENTGENLLAYVQKTRVAAAKELLKTHSVKETLELAGFWDMQSFTRVFKKYENITPAEYRKLVSPNEELF
jgi:AraC-like DNA-binding protein